MLALSVCKGKELKSISLDETFDTVAKFATFSGYINKLCDFLQLP